MVAKKALSLSHRWAMSMAQNLSNRMAHAKLIPGPTITQAAYFPFWTEAATRIKARLVAKELSRKNSTKTYFIPIPHQNITAFNGWVRMIFPLPTLRAKQKGIEYVLISNDELSVAICNDLVNYPIRISNRKAFIDAAVYQSEVVLTKIFNQKKFKMSKLLSFMEQIHLNISLVLNSENQRKKTKFVKIGKVFPNLQR